MTLWSQTQHLPTEVLAKIQELYSQDVFPIEVRHFLADWIEERVCSQYKLMEQSPQEQSQMFLEGLVEELQRKAAQMNADENMYLARMKLLTASEMFRTKYSLQPMQLFSFVQSCLNQEYELVHNPTAMLADTDMTPEYKHSDVQQVIQKLHQSVSAGFQEIRHIESQQESFELKFHECTRYKTHQEFMKSQTPSANRNETELMLRQKVKTLEDYLSTMVPQIVQAHYNLSSRLQENITMLDKLQKQVLDVELIRWKREQQLSGNGAQMPSYLNMIQEECEHLADLIWKSRQQVKEAERLSSKLKCIDKPGQAELLQDLSKQVTNMLSTLVTSTFVIEKQPPQVMKTNTRFTSTVRLLVGGQLNVNMTPPVVKVMIISEAQAQTLLKSDAHNKPPTEVCGEILNNSGTMEYQQATKQLSISFRNMQLRKIKRAEKKGTESVMDEKLTLLFSSQFSVGGGELVFQVWTLSLPVVVIVHGNQEPHGWATVTWDNAFSLPGRVPFAVPEKVTWEAMAKTLNLKFASATGHPLNVENLRFLAEKLMYKMSPPVSSLSQDELDQMPVTWSQFCKEPLPDRNFTFWEWFYSVMKVTREHLSKQWGEGLIHGFISKKQAEDLLLQQCQPGTFLLRFSDSEPGAITIAWYDPANVPEKVLSLQPFTSRDLQQRGVADRVSDLTCCVYLYPDISKDQAFSKFYTVPDVTNRAGYVIPSLKTHLPWLENRDMSGSPHHASPMYHIRSPDSQRDTSSVHNGSVYQADMFDNSSLSYNGYNIHDYMEELIMQSNFDLPMP